MLIILLSRVSSLEFLQDSVSSLVSNLKTCLVPPLLNTAASILQLVILFFMLYCK